MLLSKKVTAVTIGERVLKRAGKEDLTFYDLNYVVLGEGVGVVGVQGDDCVAALKMSLGSEVEIVLGLEKDSKSGFLYRCNVVGVKPVK